MCKPTNELYLQNKKGRFLIEIVIFWKGPVTMTVIWLLYYTYLAQNKTWILNMDS